MPALNTTSTADISFMLLVFFLVTTSIITEQGLLRRLSPVPDDEQEQEMIVDRSEMMLITITSDDAITCEDEAVSLEEVKSRVMAFVEEDPQHHVITIDADRAAKYDTYFHLQQAVLKAYATLRARRAMEAYGKSYHDCTMEERQEIASYYPQRLSDNSSTAGEGGEQ